MITAYTEDPMVLLREIASIRLDPQKDEACRFCEGERQHSYTTFYHRPGCIWVRAREIVRVAK